MSTDEMKTIEEATLSGKIESYIVDPGTGEKIKCHYQDPTQEQRRKLVDLEKKAENGDEDAEEELESLVCDTLFISDKVSSNSGLAQKQAVIAGLFRGLGKNDAVEDAKELMSDIQGNR